MLRQVAEGCINETGATEEDVVAMANKQLPTTDTGKCLSFCVMHLFNCVSFRQDWDGRQNFIETFPNRPLNSKLTDEGDFNQEDFMGLMRMGTDNETVLAMTDEVSKKCVGTKSADNNKYFN